MLVNADCNASFIDCFEIFNDIVHVKSLVAFNKWRFPFSLMNGVSGSMSCVFRFRKSALCSGYNFGTRQTYGLIPYPAMAYFCGFEEVVNHNFSFLV